MYHWTPDMIRCMNDASVYGDYHRRLAEMILPYFSGAGHICDAGCGLGDLSLALSGVIPRITGIDINPRPIAAFRDHCVRHGITNIRAVEGDIRLNPPQIPYDGMIFCLFGKSEEILDIARKQCRGTVAVIKKNYSVHRFSVGKYPTGLDGYTRMQTLLNERRIPFESRTASLEFGQPFRCFKDVRTFFNCYSRDEDPDVLTDDFLRSRIIQIGSDDFPFYMPHQRRIGLIIFQSEEII